MIDAVLVCLMGMYVVPEKAKDICAVAHVVAQSARDNSVRASTLLCIAKIETRWTSGAIGSSGECGITQILPGKTWGCKQLQADSTAMQATGRILRPDGFFRRIARRSCGGDKACTLRRTLQGYNAGTAAARGYGKRIRRATAYAQAVLSCEEKLMTDSFASLLVDHTMLESKSVVRLRDYVYFFSQTGGWGFGTVVQTKKRLSASEICVLKRGKTKAEIVQLSSVQRVFRKIDDDDDDDTL